MQYGSSYKDKSDNHSQRHLSLISHMNWAPLPEFQLKKLFKLLNCFCCSFWTHQLLLTIVHILHQAFAKLKVLWSDRTSYLVTSVSHVHPFSLKIYPSFQCILLRIRADVFILSRSAHRTQTRLAECWAQHRVYIISQSLPSKAGEPNKQDQEQEERRGEVTGQGQAAEVCESSGTRTEVFWALG